MKLSVVFEYFDKVTAPMQKTQRQTTSLMNSLKQMQNCMFKINQTAELMGRLGDTIGQLSRPGIEFQQSMADLSSITGIAGKDLDRLGEIARRTGVSSGLGASGAADAFALLASQIDVSKIGMDGLVELQSKTITLAQASGMSMEEAANSMAGTINQFGLEASEAGRIINVLAAGSKYGAAEIPQLAESFKVVGSAANAAGLSVEQTAGAVEVLSKNNLKGAEAGTALRNIVLKMQTAMGVDFRKTSLQDALVKLKPHLRDATYLTGIFGMENVAATQFLVANADRVKEMTDRVTDTNVAQEQAAIRTATWSQKIKVQTAQFNDWAIGLQQNFGGIMNFLQVSGQAGNIFMTLLPIGKAFGLVGKGIWGAGLGVVQFGRTLRVLSLAKSTASAFGYARAIASCGKMGRIAAVGIAAWAKMTKIAGLVQGGFMKTLKGIRTVMMTSVLPSLMGVIAATWAWTTALFANPITWIVLAIGALVASVVACWQKFAGFRAVILTVWDTVFGFGKAIYDYLVAPFKAAWEIIAGIAKAVSTLFKGGSLKDAGKELVGGFKNGIDAGIGSLESAVKGTIDTAAGIGGNYEMHLTQETEKQTRKEKEAEKKKNPDVQTPEGFTPDFNIEMPGVNPGKTTDINSPGFEQIIFNEPVEMPEINVPDAKPVPEINIPRAKADGSVNPVVNTPPPAVLKTSAPPKTRQSAGIRANTATVPPVVLPEQGRQTTPEIPPVVNVQTPGFRAAQPFIFRDGGEEKTLPQMQIPILKPVNQPFAALPKLENQSSDNRRRTIDNRHRTSDIGQRTSGNQTGAKIEMKFQPTINISADLTQKTKDDLMNTLRGFGEEITKMVEEVQRRNGRGAYAIS